MVFIRNTTLRLLAAFLCLTCLSGCRMQAEDDLTVPETSIELSKNVQDNSLADLDNSIVEPVIQTPPAMEEVVSALGGSEMILWINDKKVPVIWEDNDTVKELAAQAASGEISVSMSMYSDNEQVGPLGRRYPANDIHTTTNNGDIVLYSGNQIVVFYGSNSWAYTRLGKMDLPENEVTDLLSHGNVTLKITF